MLHVYQNCFVLLAECAPPAVSSPNPDDPTGPPICADWAVGPFGRVMTNAYNIYLPLLCITYHSKTTSPKWTWIASYFSVKIPSLCVSRSWYATCYHHDPCGHKDRIFMKKEGTIQVHLLR